MALAALGGVSAVLKSVQAGQSILKSINAPPVDFYSIRIENGDNQDAAGNPPSVILTDFSDKRVFGVFEGSSKADRDQCRNNKSLPIGDFDAKDLSLFKGLRKGEAPIRKFKTNNGFNLKSIDLQGGGNAICISNIIIKGSDTQARRDEMFIPIGNIGFECGFSWNWGTILGKERQRCIWLDGSPDNGANPIRSLHMDMERIAGLFNTENINEIEKIDIKELCTLFTDSAGTIPNRNDCQPNPSKRKLFKKEVIGKNITIDTVPQVKVAASDFEGATGSMDKFVGSGFVTSDNKIFNPQTGKFEEFSVIDPTVDLPAVAKVKSRAFANEYWEKADLERRETTFQTLKVEECQATVDGIDPTCTLAETIRLNSAPADPATPADPVAPAA